MTGRLTFRFDPPTDGNELTLSLANMFLNAVAANIRMEPDLEVKSTLIGNAVGSMIFAAAGRIGLTTEEARAGIDAAFEAMTRQGVFSDTQPQTGAPSANTH